MSTLPETRSTLLQSAMARLRRHPALYSACRNVVYALYAMRQGFWKEIMGIGRRKKGHDLQSVMTWDAPFPPLDGPGEMARWLRSRGIRLHESSHALYLPPQEALRGWIPAIVEFYPPNCGFKILKDLRPPAEANYLSGVAPHAPVRMRLTGTPQEQVVTANYMYCLGIGPRVWDLCCWRGGGSSCTVFVVDHVEGPAASHSQCVEFARTLQAMTEQTLLRVLVPRWRETPDFTPPHCNHNLLQRAPGAGLQYVDFQNFRVSDPAEWARQVIERARDDLHFGNGRPWRGRRYLYQSVPGIHDGGKRDTGKRWSALSDCLARLGVAVQGRMVLDVGCNSGLMLGASLGAGATWGLGWDRPNVVRHAQELLFSLGRSRFQLTGAELHPAYRLEDDIPQHLRGALPESVVLYLSVRQHIGLLDCLRRMPWRVFVYEGHQHESTRELPEILAPLLTPGVRCGADFAMADGDSGRRPVAVLVRT